MRKQAPRYFSIERVFETIAPLLTGNFDVQLVHVPCHSRGAWRCLRNLLFTARLQADVIHVTGDIYYCALAIGRHRCVLTVHDLCSLSRLKGLRKHLFSLFWYRLPLRRASVITSVSEETRRQLLVTYPASYGKVNVIPNCIDLSSIRTQVKPRIANPVPRVLIIGTGANKNLERLATAASGLGVSLRIIGHITDNIADFLNDLDIVWTSARDISTNELISEYETSDLLVFVSTSEGFGLPIIEAQALGLPVVTSNVPPMSDVAGNGALLVDPYDIAAIRSALRELSQSSKLAQELARRGAQNAQRYDARFVANQYSSIYNLLLNTHEISPEA